MPTSNPSEMRTGSYVPLSNCNMISRFNIQNTVVHSNNIVKQSENDNTYKCSEENQIPIIDQNIQPITKEKRKTHYFKYHRQRDNKKRKQQKSKQSLVANNIITNKSLDFRSACNSSIFITDNTKKDCDNNINKLKRSEQIPPIETVATEYTNKLLNELPNLCSNYKTEYIQKGINKTQVFKVRSPTKHKGNYFDLLGFDYRTQIWYEGDMIDTYDDIDSKIEKWSKPFAELADNLRPIIKEQINLNNSIYGFNKYDSLSGSISKPDLFSSEAKEKITTNNVIKNLSKNKKDKEIDEEFIKKLRLPLPKNNMRWKSDLDDKIFKIFQVDQVDYQFK